MYVSGEGLRVKKTKNFKVLIVEDECLIRENLIQKIEEMNMEFEVVGYAEDGQSALDLVRKHCPDLVITDIKMPVMDGLELAKQLHSSYRFIKILIISGYSEFEFARKAIEYDVRGFLLKPINKEKLEQALTKVLIELNKDAESLNSIALENAKSMSKEQIIDCVEHYIKENFKTEIRISDIADYMGFTPDYISHLFKKHKRESPIKYLTTLRINYAKQLLINNPELDVGVIGEMAGYSDPTYFSKVFRKQVGVYPSQYRKGTE